MSSPPAAPSPVATRPSHPRRGSGHPWHRWFARLVLDYGIAGLSFGVLLGLMAPAALAAQSEYSRLWLTALVWIPVETFCLAELGATPGKFLIGMRVAQADRSLLSWGQAFSRSFSAWANGCALLLPLVPLLTFNRQYNRLREGLETTWDTKGGFVVTHLPMSVGRGVLLILVLLVFAALTMIGNQAGAN